MCEATSGLRVSAGPSAGGRMSELAFPHVIGHAGLAGMQTQDRRAPLAFVVRQRVSADKRDMIWILLLRRNDTGWRSLPDVSGRGDLDVMTMMMRTRGRCR